MKTEMDLLNQLEAILESDPFIDEVGLIHPSQFVILSKECGESGDSSKDGAFGPRNTKFWNRDHKLGISTEVLLPLCKAAKSAFMDAMKQYKTLSSLSDDKHEDENIRNGSLSCQSFESEVMKHSRARLLLSCDFGTAWNSKFSSFHYLSMEIKMNYRAWNHRCWLVSYMTREQMLHELKKSRDWAGLHVADNSCFHYCRRLMLGISENSCCKQEGDNSSYNVENYQVMKEELDLNEVLIKRYVGREALWLHRHFLSLCTMLHLTTKHGISCHFEQKTSMNNEINIFLDNESCLLDYCSTIQDTEYEDFKAQAMYSAIYFLWLITQIPQFREIELQVKLKAGNLKTILQNTCPEKSFPSDFWDLNGSF